MWVQLNPESEVGQQESVRVSFYEQTRFKKVWFNNKAGENKSVQFYKVTLIHWNKLLCVFYNLCFWRMNKEPLIRDGSVLFWLEHGVHNE